MSKKSKIDYDVPVARGGSVYLPQKPHNDDYEDFIAAYLVSAGYHIERKLIKNVEKVEALEIDIVTTDYRNGNKNVFEVKSGGWGITDIHKLVGWKTFCPFHSSIVYLDSKDNNIDGMMAIANMQGIELIDDTDLSNPLFFLKRAYPPLISAHDMRNMAFFRYAFLIDRALEKEINDHKKQDKAHEGYAALRSYWMQVRNYSFFEPTPAKRSMALVDAFHKYRNMTARLANIGADGRLPDFDADMAIPDSVFKRLNYSPVNPDVLYGAMMVEWSHRLAILKSVVDHIVERANVADPVREFIDKLEESIVDSHLHGAIFTLSKHVCLTQYPHFWQVFIYQFGGFIIETYREEEFNLLSSLTGLPVSEIENALGVMDILFPLATGGSWCYENSKSHIRMLHHFPVPMRGTGVHVRYSLLCNKDMSVFNSKYGTSATWAIGKDMRCWASLSYKYIESLNP